MTVRQWILGLGLAIAFPALVHLALAAISRRLSTGDTSDFAYHDTTFIVYRIGWVGDIALGLAALVVYVLALRILRAKGSK
ncbi:hypothetical protein [Cohnella sp. GbtcB17]|uniref:hypothetical protein n=1 Tax=Cohnella sp. GbtcB17 TaxID=2824762 RepID=UPI001C305AB5|nr:hypothetical protein [Cohnella sp. GbtcB17]